MAIDNKVNVDVRETIVPVEKLHNNKIVHVVSHSHWDREWYMPFEKFRIRLVDLIDRVLDLLEEPNNGFETFTLDGHVLLVEDYLEIRPENQGRIRSLVEAGKLRIGPWYVLQDAFLTSGEAQLRNLQLGIETARAFGGSSMVGYFPDTFGNISQSVQMLRGFGIERAVFGRGIQPVAENNTVIEGSAETIGSELWWLSPDGSKALAVFLANWYHNAMELPTAPEEAKQRAAGILPRVEKYATSDHLLFMNGCDHQPVQSDVGEAIRVLNEHVPGYEFVHSNFDQYFDELDKSVAIAYTVAGELTSQYTDGWSTLVNTASSRLYLKQWNTKVQNELERWVEPFSTIAWTLGRTYPEAFIRHAWKLLLQNHAHDSICGCSVDEVHEEMVVRFKKSWQIAEQLSTNALAHIASQIDTVSLSTLSQDTVCPEDGTEYRDMALVVFNSLSFAQTGAVEVVVDAESEIPLDAYRLVDPVGNEVMFDWVDEGWVHGFTLPDDRFRIVWKKRRYRLTCYLPSVPSLGYQTLLLKYTGSSTLQTEEKTDRTPLAEVNQVECSLENDGAIMENEFLRVLVHSDGTLDLTDITTNHTYSGLLVFENTGDIGTEYTFIEAEGSEPILTSGTKVVEMNVRSSGRRAQLTMKHQLLLPKERSEKRRSKEKRMLELEVLLSLDIMSRRLEVTVTGDNQVKDHRLRVLFPAQLQTDSVYADAPFDVVKRDIEPWHGWTNPSKCERMQSFFSLSDGKHGLTIAAIGLPEYEVLRDGRNTMALTLLRAVGEMGDWNYFPTPGAQCPGPFTAQFAIIPHPGGYEQSLREVYSFTNPLRGVSTELHEGKLPLTQSWLDLGKTKTTVLTALKKADTFEGIHARVVNLADQPENLMLTGQLPAQAEAITEMQMNEDNHSPLSPSPTAIQVGKKKIMTIGMKLSKT